MLVEKICGAAAEEGRNLAEVAELWPARSTPTDRSFGHGADLVHRRPRPGKPTFELGDDEMEIGIGIHGEPGRGASKLGPRAEIVEQLAADRRWTLPFEPRRPRCCAFVNGMGGTPLIELYIVYNDLNRFLGERGITIDPQPDRSLHHVALEMAGCSITLLKLDDELTRLLGRAGQDRRSRDGRHRRRMVDVAESEKRVRAHEPRPRRRRALDPAFAAEVGANKEQLTQLDAAVGDGDHGINMDRGMSAGARQARRRD